MVNALNDPFVPADSLPGPSGRGPCVTLWQPEHGGHVGFAQGRWPGHVRAMPDAVSDWLARDVLYCRRHNQPMDDIVKQALVKWPHARLLRLAGLLMRADAGSMRDAGPGRPRAILPHSRGSWLQHGKLIEFIGRNYYAMLSISRFFKNGPQRVYVELEAAPWIWRVLPGFRLQSHTGCRWMHKTAV